MKRTGWLDWVLNYPRTVISCALLMTLLIGWNIPRLQMEADVKAMLPPDMDIVVEMNQLEQIFGGSELVVISIAAENIFAQSTLQKIQAMTREIEQLDFVERVISLTNAQDVQGTPDGFEVRNIMDQLPTTPAAIAAVRERIRTNNLLNGNIASTDFRKAAIIVLLSLSEEKNDDEVIYQALSRIRDRYANPETILFAGLPITRRAVATTMTGDMKVLFPYGMVLMIVFLVISFRSWSGVFLPLLVMIIVIVDTLGLMAIMKIKFTFVGLMIPVMTIAVTSSYSIHLVTHYLNIAGSDLEKRLAIQQTIRTLLTPVFLSAATTLVGFLSLQTHVLPPAREVGLLVSVGIVLSFFLSVSVVPAALMLLPVPVRTAIRGRDSLFERGMTRWGNFFVSHYRKFLIASVGLVLILASGIFKLRVDTNPIYFWRKDSEIRRSNALIDHDFGGSSQIAILAKGNLTNPQFLSKMDSLGAYLLTFPGVNRVNSIVDQLMLMNKAFHSDSAAYYAIPPDSAAVAQYLLLFTLSGDARDLDRFVDYDYQQGQILARVSEGGSTDAFRMYQQIKQQIALRFGTANFPVVTGMTAFVGVLADMVVRGQIRSLAISIVLVGLVTGLIFRSFLGGLIAIVPLSGAVLIIFGLMGYLSIPLDMATVMLSSIMIGVGVDYTVHFIHRLRQEMHHRANLPQAIRMTLRLSGRGILYNGISVMVGFMVLLVSGFLPIYFFGFLIVISIGTCLLGALTIIPSLILVIRPRFISPPGKGCKAERNE